MSLNCQKELMHASLYALLKKYSYLSQSFLLSIKRQICWFMVKVSLLGSLSTDLCNPSLTSPWLYLNQKLQASKTTTWSRAAYSAELHTRNLRKFQQRYKLISKKEISVKCLATTHYTVIGWFPKISSLPKNLHQIFFLSLQIRSFA